MTSLKGEIPNVKDFSLRMRLITIEPGGHTSFHVHKNRPGIVYIVSGSIINHEEGKAPKQIAAGEIFYETQGYAHYIENNGNVSVTLISADIVLDVAVEAEVSISSSASSTTPSSSAFAIFLAIDKDTDTDTGIFAIVVI